MKRLQMAGNKPIVLLGGGTGFVGDPSGRTDMRVMMDETTINLQTTQQELDKEKTQDSAFRAKCKALLTSQLRLLDDMVLDGEDGAEASAETAQSAEEKTAE